MITLNSVLVITVWTLIFSSIETFKNHKNCGRVGKGKVEERIVGGNGTSVNQYPFMALLTTRVSQCGATLINRRWALTAAHCLTKTDAKDYAIVLGTNSTNLLSKGSVMVQVQIIAIFRPFAFELEVNSRDDIALVKTVHEIVQIEEEDSNIRPICLPEPFAEPSSRTLIHTGWGIYKRYSNEYPHVLQVAKTELFAPKFCALVYGFVNIGLGGSTDRLYDKKICVKAKDNQACSGDSGGPLFEVANGKHFQVGITSFTIASKVMETLKYFCSGSEPVVYTKVSSYIDWIDAVISKFDDSNDFGVMQTISKPGDPFKFELIPNEKDSDY